MKAFASENIDLAEEIMESGDLLEKLKGNPAIIKRFAHELKTYETIEEVEKKIDDSVKRFFEEALREGSLGKLLRHYNNLSLSGWEFWRNAFSTANQMDREVVFKLAFDHFNQRVKHYGRRVLKVRDKEFMLDVFDEHHKSSHDPNIVQLKEFGSFFTWMEALLVTIGSFPELWSLKHVHQVFFFVKREKKHWEKLTPLLGCWFLKPSETVPGNITLTILTRHKTEEGKPKVLMIRLDASGTGWSCVYLNQALEAGTLLDLIQMIDQCEFLPSKLSTSDWLAQAFGIGEENKTEVEEGEGEEEED
jgi:hypothetical protein